MYFLKNIILTLVLSFSFSNEVMIAIGNYSDTTMEILMETDDDITGFQFDVIGASFTGASGGLAADAGFTVSVGSNETVLGFSFSGAVIPAGSNGVLTNLTGTFPENACLS